MAQDHGAPQPRRLVFVMRQLEQPGPVQNPRILVAEAAPAGDLMLRLAPGTDLLNGLRDGVLAAGGRAAGFVLLGGQIAKLHYFTGMPDPSGQRLATYGEPTHLEGPVTLLGGNAILGCDAEGAPIVHCHAVMVDREGRVHGGHLPPGGCLVGAGTRPGEDGVTAMATLHDAAGFAVSEDVETNYSIFQPAAFAGG